MSVVSRSRAETAITKNEDGADPSDVPRRALRMFLEGRSLAEAILLLGIDEQAARELYLSFLRTKERGRRAERAMLLPFLMDEEPFHVRKKVRSHPGGRKDKYRYAEFRLDRFSLEELLGDLSHDEGPRVVFINPDEERHDPFRDFANELGDGYYQILTRTGQFCFSFEVYGFGYYDPIGSHDPIESPGPMEQEDQRPRGTQESEALERTRARMPGGSAHAAACVRLFMKNDRGLSDALEMANEYEAMGYPVKAEEARQNGYELIDRWRAFHARVCAVGPMVPVEEPDEGREDTSEWHDLAEAVKEVRKEIGEMHLELQDVRERVEDPLPMILPAIVGSVSAGLAGGSLLAARDASRTAREANQSISFLRRELPALLREATHLPRPVPESIPQHPFGSLKPRRPSIPASDSATQQVETGSGAPQA